MKPKYSGRGSEKFWARVNALKGPRRWHAYELGCIIQEIETRVLRLLNEAEAAEKRSTP